MHRDGLHLNRREFIRVAVVTAGAAATLKLSAADTVTLPFENGERPLVKYPQKRPMIGLTSRPPQLETPFSVFNEGVITPNDAFFVRYHLSDIPEIKVENYKIKVDGDGAATPMELTLDDLKK